MSRHLLRKLLKLDTVDQQTNSTSNYNDDDSDKKYTTYYSTDKGRRVVTKIPSHMKISKQSLPQNSSNTFTDDLSDVSSHLLRSIVREKNINRFGDGGPTKPLTYYSTDKNSYVTTSVPERMNVNVPEDQSETNSDFDYAKRFPSIYSDIEYDISDITSKHSKDFSNHSSFNSEQDTSYDSFYDMYNRYDNLFVDKRNSNISNEKSRESNDASSSSSFNIFKESHRERPEKIKKILSDQSDASSFNIFKSSHRERQPKKESRDSDLSSL